MSAAARMEGQSGKLRMAFAIDPDWIDYNDHLNMARYPIMFDRAIDGLIDTIGLSSDPGEGRTLFALEAKLGYINAVVLRDRPTVETIVLRIDSKRVHSWQTMRVGERIVATCENLHICVDRRADGASAAPLPDAVRLALERLVVPLADWPNDVQQPVASRLATP